MLQRDPIMEGGMQIALVGAMGVAIAINFQLTGGGKASVTGAPDKISCVGSTSHRDGSRTVTRNRGWYNSSACPTPILSRPADHAFAAPPAFRLTDGDLAINREIARHRFLGSTHVAALVGRSRDRTNDRLSRLSRRR